MNIGDSTLFFASNDNVDAVYGFEPFKDTYQQALDNFALNESNIRNKIHPYCQAVSNFNGTRKIPIVSDESMGRSTALENAENEISNAVEIEYRRADEVLRQIIKDNEGKPLILKSDTEGSEFEVFDCLKDTDILRYVDAIVMEYHRNPAELINIIEEFGFRYVKTGIKLGIIYAVKTN